MLNSQFSQQTTDNAMFSTTILFGEKAKEIGATTLQNGPKMDPWNQRNPMEPYK